MIKTLRITSVIAVLMAMSIFALPIKYGVKTDPKVENFINGPMVTDVFKAALRSRTVTPVSQINPLIQQAEAYALIIDPPKPIAKAIPEQGPKGGVKPPIVVPPTVTPKFNLISTIYYPFNPEMSQALIEEGKVRRWVKQSSKVNHLLIEEVKDGMILVRNGDEVTEMKTPEKKFTGTLPILPAAGRITNPPSTGSSPVISTPAGVNSVRPPRTPPAASSAPKTEPDGGVKAGVEAIMEKIKILENESSSDGVPLTMEEKAVEIQKLLGELRNANMNISEEESQKLNELGDVIEQLQNTSLQK